MLKELKSQHRNIVQMAFNGYKNNEIAERLGMTATSVSTILRSPLGQAYLDGLQDRAQEATLDVRKKLVSLNSAALHTFERLLNPREKAPHAVQFNTAKDVLDRTGYKAPDRLHVDMTLQAKTDQELEAEIIAMQQSIQKSNSYKLEAIKEMDSSGKLLIDSSHDDRIDKNSSTLPNDDSLQSEESIPSSNKDNNNIIYNDPKELELDSLPANIFQHI